MASVFGILKRDRHKTEEGVRKTRETWFGRVARVFHSPSLDDSVWEELEETLIAADVGVDTTQGLIEETRRRVREERLSRPQEALEALKVAMVAILDSAQGPGALPGQDGQELPRPLVLLVVGVNGSGKTTSIAKLAWQFKEQGKGVLLAAADTFRAAGIEQLQVWGERLGVGVVAHRQGSDPGAVAYDALQAAGARGTDVVIIDTAGRLHTKQPLMEELRKVRRVVNRLDPSAPHQVLLVLDATTGHNGLSQARHFTEAIGCDGIFLAKLDGTAKGGIAMAICQELKLPILFIGTGEKPQDVVLFDARDFVEALLAPVPE
ncbi:MAG: signal recognition particle-docking protein FtsY [Dehalococcoidia bacterium]